MAPNRDRGSATAGMNPADIPLALYVHLPWCAKKCPYCDFNSYTARGTPPRQRYVDALAVDLSLSRELAGGRELVSMFIGGGTPSLFTPDEIAEILATVRGEFTLADDAEITMEANPGTVECGSLAGYRDAGVNRLSIGAQSFDNRALAMLGRIHERDAIAASVNEARDAGFDNLNLDVMYCLPGQDVAGALADIDAAAALEPEHLSWYHLTLEPNTVFHARPPEGLPGDSLAADIQDAGAARLVEHGFEQYEVSAWARGGRSCRHNLNYWQFGDYLAAGAGAHGKVTLKDGIRRYARPANPEAWMQALEAPGPQLETAPVAADDLVFEFMLNALRLTSGFDASLFERSTGLSSAALDDRWAELRERGLVDRDAGGHFRPSAKGFAHLNSLMAAFLPDEKPAERS